MTKLDSFQYEDFRENDIWFVEELIEELTKEAHARLSKLILEAKEAGDFYREELYKGLGSQLLDLISKYNRVTEYRAPSTRELVSIYTLLKCIGSY